MGGGVRKTICKKLTIVKTTEHSIDGFQRNTMRKILKIWWLKPISNDRLHKRTNTEKWIKIRQERTFRWYTYLMIPPKIAFEEVKAKKKYWERLIKRRAKSHIDENNRIRYSSHRNLVKPPILTNHKIWEERPSFVKQILNSWIYLIVHSRWLT